MDNAILRKYSTELGFDRVLTIEELVEDNKTMAASLQEYKELLHTKLQEYLERNLEREVNSVVCMDYINKNELYKMTLPEIAQMISVDQYWN